MSPSQPPETQWGRLAGMGVEYGAVVAVFMLLGWWVDRHWQIEGHWGTLIGAALGLIGGTYNFVREALAAVRESERQGGRQGNRPGAERCKTDGSPADGASGGSHDVDGNGRR